MKKTDGWMPLYVADYLADTTRLTTEQHGAYLLLIMDYWRNGPPEADDETLAQITKLPATQWRKHAQKLRALFSEHDGKLWHKRIEEERKKAGVISSSRSEAGKQGAAKRWGKTKAKDIANAMANAMANGMADPSQEAWQNDAPSPSPTPKTIGSGITTAGGCACASESPLAAAFVDALQLHGIPGHAADARLQRWAEEGATLAQLEQAIGVGRERRQRERSVQPLNVGFIDVLLADILVARGAPSTVRTGTPLEWHTCASGITAHGATLGLFQGADEPFPYFKARVFEAAGDGPWAWKARGAVTITGETAAADVLRRH
ncbi:hypothetical protein ASL20_09780 [Cupriavidus necator]|uniref:YdaU family protein n=1 Tax=Cupriavidus necator TaxID=106590 RepID=UPI0007356B4D|nr:DUF1376 domain-containing protein [Cupriavidus necator]KUE88902.1 hypothetical protein ASL20_09780 [Cupriavidus necator]